MPVIAGFVFDDINEDKIGAHGLTTGQVLQILSNRYIIVRNRRNRRALHLIIGTDDGGGCIAVPVEKTHDPLMWRPITAWSCKDHERASLFSERG